MEPTYHLEQLLPVKEHLEDFEGPLSLILVLLAKNKIEIRDIKISEIIDQYLDFIERLGRLDMEVTGEFIQMASYLIFIKTKMLLSSEEEQPQEVDILIESLEKLKAQMQLERIKQIIPDLQSGTAVGFGRFIKEQEPLPRQRDYPYTIEPEKLLEAMIRLQMRPESEESTEKQSLSSIAPRPIVYNVRNKSRELVSELKSGAALTLESLYKNCKSRSEIVATLLSLLELSSIGRVCISFSEEKGWVIELCPDNNPEDASEGIESEFTAEEESQWSLNN